MPWPLGDTRPYPTVVPTLLSTSIILAQILSPLTYHLIKLLIASAPESTCPQYCDSSLRWYFPFFIMDTRGVHHLSFPQICAGRWCLHSGRKSPQDDITPKSAYTSPFILGALSPTIEVARRPSCRWRRLISQRCLDRSGAVLCLYDYALSDHRHGHAVFPWLMVDEWENQCIVSV